jgi:23S rRNA (uracil1939-C5)-methyltransferase
MNQAPLKPESKETHIIDIHDLSRGGAGVGRLENQKIVFVPYTLPGDRVKIRLLSTQKNYSNAELVELTHPSPQRVQPRCKVFGQCGGCEWQMAAYPQQWETKLKGLIHSLKKQNITFDFSKIEEYPAKNPWNYRNRIQLRVQINSQQKPILGFYKKNSHELVSIQRCEIVNERINTEIQQLLTSPTSNTPNTLNTLKDHSKLEIQLTGSEVQKSWNQPHAALGFRQINDEQNQLLQQWILNEAIDCRQKSDTFDVLDLYGGSGNCSQALTPLARSIYCVDEYVSQEKNESSKTIKVSERVDRWLKKNHHHYTKEKHPHPVFVILDPPREGLGRQRESIVADLSRMNLQKILLIGCDLDRWSSDLAYFCSQGWKLQKIGALDFFPQTPHLESLAVLTREN